MQTEQVRRYFSITPREADLLVGLCNGLDPASYASQEGISIHTARSQLKNLMAKMNARRQSDLVRMTLSSPVGIFQFSN
nr:helix-turn-helix transcriptional regulator [Aurantiacibacter rhizosphaerae]